MQITIIGAGRIGAALAKQLHTAGNDVRISNSRGPETLADVAVETGAQPVAIDQAATGADVLILAIPFGVVPDAAAALAGTIAADTVVIDAGNYVPGARDTVIDTIEDGLTESVWVQRALQHPIVKAFNTVAAASLIDHAARNGDDRIALPVAGDNETAVEQVVQLGDAIGFRGFHSTSLDESWRQQPGTPVYTRDLPLKGARTAIASASPTDTSAWRAAMAARSAR